MLFLIVMDLVFFIKKLGKDFNGIRLLTMKQGILKSKKLGIHQMKVH